MTWANEAVTHKASAQAGRPAPLGAVKQLVSVEEYLHTSYEPDCDYVDGELMDRNVGEKKHSKIQFKITYVLRECGAPWKVFAIQETRVQVTPSRFRAPDVCAYVGQEPDEEIFTAPPFLCVEILSREDRVSRMMGKIGDYLAFRVKYVWVIDPRGLRAWVYTRDKMREVKDTLRTEDPRLEIPLAGLMED